MTSTPRPVTSRPTANDLPRLRSLASAAAAVDGHPPFNDQTWASLRAGEHGVWLLTLDAAGSEQDAVPDAAAVLTALPAAEPPEDRPGVLIELVVHPRARRAGLGRRLLRAALEQVPSGSRIETWSHGGHPGARVLAEQAGLSPVRELWVMALEPDAAAALPDPTLPESVTVDRFRVGQDEEAWLRVNADAFAFHPEQGSMTLSDLQAREREDWFDPEGFFLAHDASGELLGFHWTKVTRDPSGAALEAEVYAVGVSPTAQGTGLGRALTVIGLHHLARLHPQRILLYVEADNEAAVHLYRSLGFTVADADLLFAR